MNGPTKQQKGFILPTLTSVTVILLMLATILLTSGTSSLRTATHDQQSDQALFAAEAGLVRATAEYAKSGSLSSPYEGTLSSGARYEVTITENKAGVETHVPDGPEIPGKTVYFLSRGYSENGTFRETAALFQYGLEAFKVGALGDQIDLTDSEFDAYNSAEGDYDPTRTENELPLLATNIGTGEPVTMTNSKIDGDLFVGKGGSDAQVDRDATSELGTVHSLTDPITLDKIEVPEDGDGGGDDYWDIPPVGDLRMVNVDGSGVFHFDDGFGLSISIDPSKVVPGNPGATVAAALRADGLDVIPGTGPYGGYGVQITRTNGHSLFLNLNGLTGETESYYSRSGSAAPVVQAAPGAIALSNLLYSGGGGGPGSATPSNLTNPTAIEPGHYDTININDGGTRSKLAKSGVYVVDHLNISPGNSLALENPDHEVTIYVKESMSVDGKDTIVNTTRRAPKMKIFYVGSGDVNLQGGSQSYYSLVAPEAKVSLRSLNPSDKTHFFGALVGKTVSVTNAMFHFDVDTKGIGTGTRGTGILLMNRHRL